MNISQKKLVLFLAILLLGMALIMEEADARQWPGETKTETEQFDGGSYLAAYPDVYQKMKSALSCWMARLPAGPSPSGPGHQHGLMCKKCSHEYFLQGCGSYPPYSSFFLFSVFLKSDLQYNFDYSFIHKSDNFLHQLRSIWIIS